MQRLPETSSFPARGALAAALATCFALGSAAPRAGAQDVVLPQVATPVAYPNLKFDRPVALAYPKDDTSRYFVVEQHQAKIWSFPSSPRDTSEKKLFLQLPDEMNRGNEEGLLGMAFHPKYKENGQFFVYYSAKDDQRRSVVSRFNVSSDDPTKADPTSEKRIWVSDVDKWENHNGGTILFGPDGFLYITLGDGGAGGDPLNTGQNPKDWFGSILRIDVDHPAGDAAYGIPADNPALRSKAHAHWAPEVYAIGLRNVWKFSFDRQTGDLWAGDVGQNLFEYVHKIDNGGNYGWSIREGFHAFEPQRRQKADTAAKMTPPLAEYPHKPTAERPDSGLSITGGYVYRGEAIPALKGWYVYGDYDSGRIWGLKYEGGKVAAGGELLKVTPQTKLNITSFDETPEGELLILAFDGRIHELAPASK
ncbi:PQQ-dependent sugar dehydrogenase [Paludisphaera mucosa]|uniref:PQQ-dependent sugar dehydrogenase n=1 Tax=Paludisphaera mucosa TaxID=3030827 RepID=A0ABT6F7C0_9BACT|nr:PQQ-dependent sugar dehydrogenase [Paludisphaera mucosa]MDG3003319.1 PQQ-dependent sugar dehydrogenase [Paludisphaera mucosa]